MLKETGRQAGIIKNLMPLTKPLLIVLWIVAGSILLSAHAQCTAKNEAFQSGEKVYYDLYFNWKFVWYKAGDATMTIKDAVYNGKPAYQIDLIAAGNKRADFFFKLRDTLTSVVSRKLEPIYFRKGAVEGKRYWTDEAFFSFKNGMSTVTQKRIRDYGEPQFYEHTNSQCVHDMLSIIAHARSFNPSNYQVNDRILFPMATGKRVEEQILIYRGKTEFEAEDGKKYNCLKFSLVEMKKGKEEEVITFFVTDDKNHLLVRLDLFLNFGSAKAFLRKVEGNRHPLTSIVGGN